MSGSVLPAYSRSLAILIVLFILLIIIGAVYVC